MEEIITFIPEALTGIVSFLVSWFLARKKNKLELENQESVNLRENLRIYQEIIDDLKRRFDAEMLVMRRDLEIMQRDLEECRKNRHT